MDKGIRAGVNYKFRDLLPQLKQNGGTLDGKAFRKNVIGWAIESYDVSVASACTHYNFALQKAKVDSPALVQGLGRPPEKNNGGRKKKAEAPAAVEALTGSELVLSNILAAREGNEGNAPEAPAEAPKEEAAAPVLLLEAPKYSVRKVSDGTVVCEGLTIDEANALIEKAAAAKKAKLELVA